MLSRIVHLSDFHFDGSPEVRRALRSLVDSAIAREPDLVVVTGDLSADGRPAELDEVARELDRFGDVPRVVIPGNRDLEPSVGPPGEARPLPVDSDLDYFLALEPALTLGFDDSVRDDASTVDPTAGDPEATWTARFGSLAPVHRGDDIHVVGVTSTPRLRSEALEVAARQMRRAGPDSLRVFALHHGLLPVPGRKLREGDLSHRSGDVLALLSDLGVDLALHGHIHRANAWQVSDGRGSIVVASAGALVNDGRRDASYLEILAERGMLAVWRRSVSTGRPTLLYEGVRAARR
jgi:3',5'-cyclic AMP phosphodiesterase CpdA